MTKGNFQNKELRSYKGMVLCDDDNLPKVYSGAKRAIEAADKVNGKIYQISPLKQKYYVVK